MAYNKKSHIIQAFGLVHSGGIFGRIVASETWAGGGGGGGGGVGHVLEILLYFVQLY